MTQDFDPRDRDRLRYHHELDNMRSFASYTHGSAFGEIGHFLAILAVSLGQMLRELVFFAGDVLRRRRNREDER